jgi:glycosyltransferase involved in cell wall biosynthesis
MKICITDFIGIKSGSDSYTKSMKKCLEKLDFNAVCVYSNHHNDSVKYFPNLFDQNLLGKILSYLKNIINFYKLLCGSADKVVIHQFFGSINDFPVLVASLFSSQLILDVHEISMIDKPQPCLDLLNKVMFKLSKAKLIIHSPKIKNILVEMNARAILQDKYILCNHAPPEIMDEYEIHDIAIRIRQFFEDNANSRKFLFFGDIRPSKGIEAFLEMAGSNTFSRDKFLCVGQDSFRIVNNSDGLGPNIFFENRRVSDAELHFLFTNSDYLVLPYKTVSQSGVAETAVYLKCKIICSHVFINSLALIEYEEVIFFDFFESRSIDFNMLETAIVGKRIGFQKQVFEDYFSYDSSHFKRFILDIG